MKYPENDIESITALRDTLLKLAVKYKSTTNSFVGSDKYVKETWGEDICASDINQKLKDLIHYPHIFVLACLMDRQIKAEKAWAIPYIICKRLCNGNFDFNSLYQLNPETIKTYFIINGLHRFPADAADTFIGAIKRIAADYDGDASKIWRISSIGSGCPASSEVIYRFMQFEGCGIKIASMAANILHRDFKIKYSDYSSLDISPDIHVRRVLFRSGLLEDMNDTESLIYRARMLHPEYPGKIDYACWETGRNFCSRDNKPDYPDCGKCPLKEHCKFNEDILWLNQSLKSVPGVTAIEKVSIKDIRPFIANLPVEYRDLSKNYDFDEFFEWIRHNEDKIICLDNVESLEFTPSNDNLSQLLRFFISQEEFYHKGDCVSFENYHGIILSDKDGIKNSGYNFMSYAADKKCIKYIL